MANEKVSLERLKRPITPPKDDEDRSEPHVRFTVDLPDSDHHFLKMLAAESRLTMSDMVRGAVKLMREQQDVMALVKRRARSL